eukprot:SAG31_NODE_1123_length_9787_cov_5.258877_6_plen_313_part_00
MHVVQVARERSEQKLGLPVVRHGLEKTPVVLHPVCTEKTVRAVRVAPAPDEEDAGPATLRAEQPALQQLDYQHDVRQVVYHVLPIQLTAVDLGRCRADFGRVQHQHIDCGSRLRQLGRQRHHRRDVAHVHPGLSGCAAPLRTSCSTGEQPPGRRAARSGDHVRPHRSKADRGRPPISPARAGHQRRLVVQQAARAGWWRRQRWQRGLPLRLEALVELARPDHQEPQPNVGGDEGREHLGQLPGECWQHRIVRRHAARARLHHAGYSVAIRIARMSSIVHIVTTYINMRGGRGAARRRAPCTTKFSPGKKVAD